MTSTSTVLFFITLGSVDDLSTSPKISDGMFRTRADNGNYLGADGWNTRSSIWRPLVYEVGQAWILNQRSTVHLKKMGNGTWGCFQSYCHIFAAFSFIHGWQQPAALLNHQIQLRPENVWWIDTSPLITISNKIPTKKIYLCGIRD